MRMDDRRTRQRHTAERRRNVRRHKTILGCALGLGIMLLILFLGWPLLFT